MTTRQKGRQPMVGHPLRGMLEHVRHTTPLTPMPLGKKLVIVSILEDKCNEKITWMNPQISRAAQTMQRQQAGLLTRFIPGSPPCLPAVFSDKPQWHSVTVTEANGGRCQRRLLASGINPKHTAAGLSGILTLFPFQSPGRTIPSNKWMDCRGNHLLSALQS